MYLLSDASIAFTTPADGCSPIAWRNIVKSDLLLTISQCVGFCCVSTTNISGRILDNMNKTGFLKHTEWMHVSYYLTVHRFSSLVNKTWTVIFSFSVSPFSSEVRKLSHVATVVLFPREKDDETNPEPFDQMKLFSQAIFQCHISLCLIHEVGLSRWHHLSSSSRFTGLSWPLSSRSRETDASKEHLSVKDSWNWRETHESYMVKW